MYRQLPDQDHHLCTQPIAPYQQPVTDTFVDINLNLLPASKDTLRQHTACDTNVRPDSTPTYGSVEIAHQSTCRKYLKYVEARSSTTATHKRKTERQMKHVLFGEGTECRRFSADLSRWSTKSAEHPLRKSQPCCCSCQPCPIHLAPTNGTIIQPLDVSSCNAALAISFASNNIGYGGEVGDPSTNQSGTSIEHDQVETVQLLFFQVFIPFLVAGFGNVAVGLLLAHVQHWPVFRQLNGLMMLTSAFLGFKGAQYINNHVA